MSFRTRNGEKSYKPAVKRSFGRIRSLSIVRDDILLKLMCVFFALLVFAACNNDKTSATNTQQPPARTADATTPGKKNILFFGDSLTAGYGLDDEEEAFPGVIKRRIDSLKLPYHVINAGVSGETTAGGLGRIDWTLKQKVDIFILELGANDGLRGVPVSETKKNLHTIITKVRAKYPDAKIILAGMMVPPSMGADYADSFKAVFPAIAEKDKVELIPFLLDHVAGIAELNQGDGIHPTAEGAKIVANNVWVVLKQDL